MGSSEKISVAPLSVCSGRDTTRSCPDLAKAQEANVVGREVLEGQPTMKTYGVKMKYKSSPNEKWAFYDRMFFSKERCLNGPIGEIDINEVFRIAHLYRTACPEVNYWVEER